ncbi:FGGY-family carbohydrate kinase [Actinomycetospora chlora]|uniref:FGGY-family carbohydrate kinase n=1 Tax=Actinomycetospora chlora TaxID=663608 RepID=UPI0031EAC90E
MTERTWIGVDLGTQSVRALAVDDAGGLRAEASRPLQSHRDRGADGSTRHEQDPASWCAAVDEVLAEVAGRVDVGTVGGIAVDATSGTVVLDGASGFLTAGVMYDDGRGADRAARAQEAGAETWSRLGHRIGGTWALPTVMALLDEHPDGRVRHQTDVVTGHLVGRPTATDTSTALKTGYDVIEGRWPAEVLTALGVDPARLPDVVLPGTRLGGLAEAVAATTGLRAGTPVVAGMTDGCAAQIGAGAVAPGTWNAVLGTTLVLKGVTEGLVHDPTGTVYSHRGPQGGWWLPGGASSTGAGVLGDVVPADRFDAVTAVLREEGPPAATPVVYPLAGHGERFPFAVADAEGFWLDGDRARPLAELAAAVGETAAFAGVCEGVAFVERLCLEHLETLGADVSGTRTISGGATRNPWWNQRRADVAGVPLQRPRSAEPAFGMAVLARAAADADGGEPDLVAAAAAMVRVDETVEPRADAALEERYGRFHAAIAGRGWLTT